MDEKDRARKQALIDEAVRRNFITEKTRVSLMGTTANTISRQLVADLACRIQELERGLAEPRRELA